MAKKQFYDIGDEKTKIEVKISYRIIQLFSEGLYTSPNKAIEELVSNAFDAGAHNAHVILSPDLVAKDSTIVVVDDGTGMDINGLKKHWIIGVSDKRNDSGIANGRKQIGKFGIGKLATFVLARRLTHICKRNGHFYSTSMDYSRIPEGEQGGIETEEKVTLPLRELTEEQAKVAIGKWVNGNKPGFKAFKLFGPKATDSWSIAVMSNLKDLATELKRGRLRWVLQTAMPLRDDFILYLNGDQVPPSKLGKRLKRWGLGKDMKKLQKPAPVDDLEVTSDLQEPEKSIHRYGLTHPELGRVTGYAEIYRDLLTEGKSADVGRSHGFFVYVCGRLVNIDDEYFGIDRNQLRHGTFSRFRMVVYIDRLDKDLRSSRETIRDGVLVNITRNILRAVFNQVRTEHEKLEREASSAVSMSVRLASSPGSLTRGPLISLIEAALEGKFSPRYLRFPSDLSRAKQKEFLKQLKERIEDPAKFVQEVMVDILEDRGIALYDAENAVLIINKTHPFVASFLDEYETNRRSLALELYAMSEVLLEAYLYEVTGDENMVRDVMDLRDELLKHLVRSSGKKNAYLVAQALEDSVTDADALEIALVDAFDSMGFDVSRVGGNGKPDGIAKAYLGASAKGGEQRYIVSLEAKSKQRLGVKVKKSQVGVSTVARQRDEFHCDHAIVVGPDFETKKGNKSAVIREIKANSSKTGKTITLMRVCDLASLVRLVPLKRIDLGKLRELFQTCTSSIESGEWVKKLKEEKKQSVPPWRDILEEIWKLQNETPGEPVEFKEITTAMRRAKKSDLKKDKMRGYCRALAALAPDYVSVRTNSIELSQRPDKVLDAMKATFAAYPENEQVQAEAV
ncbi:MAG: hypothetical protein DRP65_00265 [Planctomycetota bacterium]|nr:MAG: hypothetical protein DRP65_00265 [Planctomycetota bacterium]